MVLMPLLIVEQYYITVIVIYRSLVFILLSKVDLLKICKCFDVNYESQNLQLSSGGQILLLEGQIWSLFAPHWFMLEL